MAASDSAAVQAAVARPAVGPNRATIEAKSRGRCRRRKPGRSDSSEDFAVPLPAEQGQRQNPPGDRRQAVGRAVEESKEKGQALRQAERDDKLA
jgi:hypothetical protein